MARYEFIEHTADTGLRVYAPDLKGLFVLAATGLFDIMVELETVRPRQSYSISLVALDLEELFVAWLRELIFLFSAREAVLGRFEIEKIEVDNQENLKRQGKQEKQVCRLKAVVYGEKLDLGQHQIKTEVKAVTYHQLKIERVKGGWKAEVIFDI